MVKSVFFSFLDFPFLIKNSFSPYLQLIMRFLHLLFGSAAMAAAPSQCPDTSDDLKLLITGRSGSASISHTKRVFFILPMSATEVSQYRDYLRKEAGSSDLHKLIRERPFHNKRVHVVSSNWNSALVTAYGLLAENFKDVDDMKTYVLSDLQELSHDTRGAKVTDEAIVKAKGISTTDGQAVRIDQALKFFNFINAQSHINTMIHSNQNKRGHNRFRRFCKYLAARGERDIIVFGAPKWLEEFFNSFKDNPKAGTISDEVRQSKAISFKLAVDLKDDCLASDFTKLDLV
jgi:hypothetical protein